MKKLKKFAALLLAGVMVMALLTACGGGGGSGTEAQAEAKIMNDINSGRTVALSNDESLRQIASSKIDTDVTGGLGGFIFSHKVHVEHGIVTVVAKYDYENTILQKLINWVAADPTVDVDINQMSNWSKVGVVVKVVDGHTYVAVSVQVSKPA